MSDGSRVSEVLAGKYRLDELLGAGGMGEVYRALNVDIGRIVAIKVLRAEHAKNEVLVERFLREARAANLVRHPNVVDVLDIGRDEAGSPFIVQELLKGEDLAHYAARRGKLPFDEVATLLCPVIDAVAEAHAQDVVHRDIKPENVFLAMSGKSRVPKLLDFGISKIRAANIRATEVGMMMGTPAYMAPEQVQGARDADARSDVWAIGVMLFELLSGRLPFDDDSAPALFFSIATKDAPRLIDVADDIAPDVSQIVERCLRRAPAERYPSAAELARDLRHVMEGTDVEPTQTRSIPPGIAAGPSGSGGVPDLMIPELRMPGGKPVSKNAPGQAGAKTIQNAPAVPVPKAPAVPALNVPAPTMRSEGRAPTPASNAAPQIAPPVSSGRVPASGRLLEDDPSMPGMMLGPMDSPVSRARPRPREAAFTPPPEPTATDMSPIVGLAVVGLVIIFGVGILMQTVHRSTGWPVARFVLGPASSMALLVQVGLGVLAAAIAVSYARTAHRHWTNELGGGRSSAIINAGISAGALFASVELVSSAW